LVFSLLLGSALDLNILLATFYLAVACDCPNMNGKVNEKTGPKFQESLGEKTGCCATIRGDKRPLSSISPNHR
jgi:hypothetical protein